MLEERLRFQVDPENDGYILPKGPRTFILRKGTNEDTISDELYRINVSFALIVMFYVVRDDPLMPA